MMILESFNARCKSLACSDVNFYVFEIKFTSIMVFNALRFSAILLNAHKIHERKCCFIYLFLCTGQGFRS